MCFVWSCLLNSAERNYVSYAMIDSWASIPAGLWGENRTTTVPGMQRADADAAVLSASGGECTPTLGLGCAAVADSESRALLLWVPRHAGPKRSGSGPRQR